MANVSRSFTVRRKSVTFLEDRDCEVFTSEDMDNGETDDNVATSSTDYTPFNEDPFTDIALIVEGETLHTNRSLLAFASPVFSCMFTADFREKTEKVISLPGKILESVRDMLAFLHPGVSFNLTKKNVFPLLILAEEYQIGVLKTMCEEFILNDLKNQICPTSDYTVRCLEIAEKCSLHQLHEKCIEVLADPDVPLKELKASSELSLQTKAIVFEKRIVQLEEEKQEAESWKTRVTGVRRRLQEIVCNHDEHCRCRIEVKLRSPIQRACPYCSRTWCSDNISSDSYRNSYQFYCNHKIGYHVAHDATIRNFLEQDDAGPWRN